MPSITVNFANTLNESIQIGDFLYYSTTTVETMQGNPNQPYSEVIVEVGQITAINYATNVVTANIANSTALPTTSSFFLFGKDNRVNMKSLLGYYADVEFTNNDTIKAELFSVGSEIFESSK